MGLVAWVIVLSGLAAGAEEWADEPVPAVPAVLATPPRLGPVLGAHLAMTQRSNAAPAGGVRLGARLRVAPHVALGLVGLWEVESVFGVDPGLPMLRTWGPWLAHWRGDEPRVVPVHGFFGLLRLEAFSVSAFERVLVPELTVAVQFGAGRLVAEGQATTGFRWGLSLGLTRLRPSGWWVPVFLELGQDWAFVERGGEASWHLVVGVGL